MASDSEKPEPSEKQPVVDGAGEVKTTDAQETEQEGSELEMAAKPKPDEPTDSLHQDSPQSHGHGHAHANPGHGDHGSLEHLLPGQWHVVQHHVSRLGWTLVPEGEQPRR